MGTPSEDVVVTTYIRGASGEADLTSPTDQFQIHFIPLFTALGDLNCDRDVHVNYGTPGTELRATVSSETPLRTLIMDRVWQRHKVKIVLEHTAAWAELLHTRSPIESPNDSLGFVSVLDFRPLCEDLNELASAALAEASS